MENVELPSDKPDDPFCGVFKHLGCEDVGKFGHARCTVCTSETATM